MSSLSKDIEKAQKENAAAEAAYTEFLKNEVLPFSSNGHVLPDPTRCELVHFLVIRGQAEVTVKHIFPAADAEAQANKEVESIKCDITSKVRRLPEYQEAFKAWQRVKYNAEELAEVEARLSEIAQAEQENAAGKNDNFSKRDAITVIASLEKQQEGLKDFGEKLREQMVQRSNALAVRSGILGSEYAHAVRIRRENATKDFTGTQEQLTELTVANVMSGFAPSLANHAMQIGKDACPPLPVNPAKPYVSMANIFQTQTPKPPPMIPLTRKEMIRAKQEAMDNAPKVQIDIPFDPVTNRPLVPFTPPAEETTNA